MAAFVPAAQRVRAEYNYVAAFDLHRPDVESVLTQRYGYEMLSGILDTVGHSKPTSSLEYEHHEADRLMPKLLANNGGAGGATATFTTAAAANLSFTQNTPPTFSTNNVATNPARVGDLILIKPASGVVSASNYVRARVTAVTATTFDAAALTATAIPAIAADTEIFIYGNAFGEGSAQPVGRQNRTLKFTNNLQIIKDTHQITGSEKNVVLWVETQNPETGQMGYTWSIKGESDTLIKFLNFRESSLLIGDFASATTAGVMNEAAAADSPITYTQGLIPFILSQGNLSNYSSLTGWTLADAEDLVKELDKQKGSKQNMLMAGINLSLQIDRELGDRFQAGAISYGNFNFPEEKAVNLEFSTFRIGEYTFHKKTYSTFNDLQTYGADGYGFPNEGMVIPMDNQMDGKTREEIPSLRKRYLADPDTGESRELVTAAVSLLQNSEAGRDQFETRYISHCGFEGFAGNRFAYIKQA